MDVWETALGFMDAQVLLTAEELRVFDALDDAPCTASEVGAHIGLAPEMAARLLTALCAIGAVRRQADGRFVNAGEVAAQLVRGRPGYVGGLFHHVRDELYPLWAHLREALTEGRDQWHRAFPERAETRSGSMYDDPAALRTFMDGMHGLAYAAGRELAAHPDVVPDDGWLVDVGGAAASFALELAEARPRLRATVADLAPVQPLAEERICQHGLADRVGFAPCNFWEDPIPDGADAYVLGFILHDWDTDGGSRLLARLADAAPSGATLLVGEYLLDDDRTGPRFVARQDLNMLVAARGQERSLAEYTRWLGDFGFDVGAVVPTRMGKHFLVARRR